MLLFSAALCFEARGAQAPDGGTTRPPEVDRPPHAEIPNAPAAKPSDLAHRIVVERSAVGYDTNTRTLAAMGCWLQEGDGEGCEIDLECPAAKKRVATVRVYESTDPRPVDRKVQKAVAQLESLLAQGKYVALQKTPWPQGSKSEAAMPLPALMVSWHGGQIVVRDGKHKKSHRVKVVKPWKAEPVAIYAAVGVPVLIVEVRYDPGAAYSTEGLNINTTFETIDLSIR